MVDQYYGRVKKTSIGQLLLDFHFNKISGHKNWLRIFYISFIAGDEFSNIKHMLRSLMCWNTRNRLE